MNYFSYRTSLNRLSRERDKEYKQLSKMVKDAEKTGGHDKGRDVWMRNKVDYDLLCDQISVLKTAYLVSQAEKRSLPTPPFKDENGCWQQGHCMNRIYLTNKGITELRSLIYKDRKEKMEFVSYWVTVLFGLIGVITGLVAVLQK